jgi:hypothetical protein
LLSRATEIVNLCLCRATTSLRPTVSQASERKEVRIVRYRLIRLVALLGSLIGLIGAAFANGDIIYPP